MELPLYCGQATCKSSVSRRNASEPQWPIRCGACGAALYPEDVLKRLLERNELEPEGALLMTQRGVGRVAVQSNDLGRGVTAPKVSGGPTGKDALDRILAKADLGQGEPVRQPEPPKRTLKPPYEQRIGGNGVVHREPSKRALDSGKGRRLLSASRVLWTVMAMLALLASVAIALFLAR